MIIILDKGGIDLVCLDFSKAFDSISHKSLFGFNNKLLNWLENYLSGQNSM